MQLLSKKVILFLSVLVPLAIIVYVIAPHPSILKQAFHSRELENESGKESELNEQEEIKSRMRQEFLMTQDPATKTVPVERLIAAENWNNTRNAYLKMNPSKIETSIAWQERGPNNIGGRVRSILFDAQDATNNTVFVGSVGGGLWKTTNFLSGTPSWTQIASVSANLAITTIAQDPNTKTIMYAGSGEGYFNGDAIRGLGIYKSTDGGTTWALLASTTTGGTNAADFNYVQKIVVYSNGDIYAAGTSLFCNRGGVLKSTAAQGGTSWTRVVGTSTGSCNTSLDLIGYDIEKSASGDLYATTQGRATGNNGKIWRSPAGGTVGNAGTWTDITPTPRTGGAFHRIQVACAPSNNDKVYAIFAGATDALDSIMSYSVAGATWSNANVSTNWCDAGSSTSLDFTRGQAWYDLTLAVQPNNDAVVYAGGVDIMKTSNSGSAWAQFTQWASGCAVLPTVHADIHNIVYLPGSNSQFVVVNDGGVYYYDGTSFSNKDASLDITQYYSVDMDPASASNLMLAGAQDNGTHKFNGAGINSVTTATGGDGGFCYINQTTPTYQITSYTGSNYTISRDGGTSFSTTAYFNGADRFINPGDLDNAQNLLYCSSAMDNIMRIGNITSGTPTSTSFNFGGANSQSSISAVKVDPNTANRVFFAFSTADFANANQVPVLYYADNANGASPTFHKITTLPGAITVGYYLSSIDVENGNANHLLITFSNYGVQSVWESTDLGLTWTSLDNNGVNLPDMPVRWGVFIPQGFNPGLRVNNIGGIILATEMGVYSASTINGTTTVWSANNNVMGNVRADMVKIRAADKLVAVATHGRGVFTGALFAGALPVNITAFSGRAVGDANSLLWSVENEYNSAGYQVERSYTNNAGFEKIGFVNANSTNTSNTYHFDDASLDLGKANAYYRLKQIDVDGHYYYSDIIVIKRAASKKLIEYISADNSSLYLRINNNNPNQTLKIRILDAGGKLIKSINVPNQTQRLNISNLSAGVYFLSVTNSYGDEYTNRFVK